jgi:hypothetical protein
MVSVISIHQLLTKGMSPMSNDLSDLHGTIPTALRWNAEDGVLGHSYWDEETGARSVKEIDLGSSLARFVTDLLTRERGYGRVRTGSYDMRLTPVNSPPPEWPNDEEFKPAIGCWLWNPVLGEVRLETNGAIFRGAVSTTWDRCRSFKEASEGLQPVIDFSGRRQMSYAAIGRTFWAPVIEIVGWMPRDKTPFARREPTVAPPPALESQVAFGLLSAPRQGGPARASRREDPVRQRGKVEPAAEPKRDDTLEGFLDDDLPDQLK